MNILRQGSQTIALSLSGALRYRWLYKKGEDTRRHTDECASGCSAARSFAESTRKFNLRNFLSRGSLSPHYRPCSESHDLSRDFAKASKAFAYSFG